MTVFHQMSLFASQSITQSKERIYLIKIKTKKNYERMSLTNVPHTLCVVSTSDETTYWGICLTSNKNLHWASGGMFGPKIAFFGTIFSLKIGLLSGKYFKKQTNRNLQPYFFPSIQSPEYL